MRLADALERVGRLAQVVALMLSGSGLVMIQVAAAAPHQAGELVAETLSVALNGSALQYEIGTFYVPENRAAIKSRTIGVGFARIKATPPSTAPPIFLLPGGPGNTLLETFSDCDNRSQLRLASWATLSEVGDVVLVEQRGHTTRGEMLELATSAAALDRPRTVQADSEETLALAKAASAANPDRDLAGYTVIQCAADVNDLRRMLGYDRVTLMGTSFGSQWSFAFMQLYPDSVARALLSGVEPLDYGYDMPSHVMAALQRIAFDADQDPALAPYLPTGGTMAAVRALRDRFAGGAVKVSVRDARTGKSQVVTLGLGDFQLALVSRAEHAEAWPAFVLSLFHKRYAEWASEVIEQRNVASMAIIAPLIDTSLGVTAAREHQLRTDVAIDFVGTWSFEAYLATAREWPTLDVGDELRIATESPIPVLFVQGDWDTSTPIENTLNVLPYFQNGHAILVHRGMHKGPISLLSDQPEIQSAVYEFLKTGSLQTLPASVTRAAPKFAVPAFAAPPPSTHSTKQ